MWYILIYVLVLLLILFLIVMFGNYLLRKLIDSVLKKKEGFTNTNNKINPLDDCRKKDEISLERLNFQTGTNIPISPFYYKNYVGTPYIVNENDKSKIRKDEGIPLKKNKLLYDGIWDSVENIDNPLQKQSD